MLEKERTAENLNALKNLVQKDIIGSIQKNYEVGNITGSDVGRLMQLTKKLYRYLYSEYEQMEVIEEMDESLILEYEDLDRKYAEIDRRQAENEKKLREYGDIEEKYKETEEKYKETKEKYKETEEKYKETEEKYKNLLKESDEKDELIKKLMEENELLKSGK